MPMMLSEGDLIPPLSPQLPPANDGPSRLLSSRYASTRREMIGIANNLFETGVNMDIEIPMIAIIGSQSVGKSSVIEAMSGITLPRASGTCTRCPTYCRLKYTAREWKCNVSLMLTVNSEGENIKTTIVPFGDEILEKSAVTERIRRAQRAILNPSTPAQLFLSGEDIDPGAAEVTFSKNCVSLDISGPDLPDLCFVDLPGIIAVSVAQVAGEIELIRELVTEYVSKESCIILITISCETELDNQGGYEIVRKFDPEGKRTIGVLTKPDRISGGDEPEWLRILMNNHPKLTLENGWYTVKSPNTQQLQQGMTHEEAREEERRYFMKNKPWSELSLKYRKQLGSDCLAERCSEVLAALMARRVPEITDVISKTLLATEQQLKELPKEPTKDPIGEIYNLISRFAKKLGTVLEGTPDPDGLLQSVRPHTIRFKKAIRATAPDFRPYDRPHGEVKEDSLPPNIAPDFLYNEEPPHPTPRDDKAIFINEVAERAHKSVTRELPDHFPFVITEEYVREFVHEWHIPTVELFEKVGEILDSKIKGVIRSEFSQYPLLQQHVITIITDYLATRAVASREYLERLLDMEKRPRTLNDHYYRDYRDKFLAHYKAARPQYNNLHLLEQLKTYSSTASSDSPLNESVSRILADYNALGIHGLQPIDLAKVLKADPREAATHIMASVRAYFQVAYKRFVDNVAMAVDDDLILGLNRDQSLETVLRRELGVGSADGYQICSEYLEEDPHMAKYREELRNKKERLSKARRELDKLRR